jgi:hypothetical protein
LADLLELIELLFLYLLHKLDAFVDNLVFVQSKYLHFVPHSDSLFQSEKVEMLMLFKFTCCCTFAFISVTYFFFPNFTVIGLLDLKQALDNSASTHVIDKRTWNHEGLGISKISFFARHFRLFVP